MSKQLDVEVPKIPKKLRTIAKELETPIRTEAELTWCELMENPLIVMDQIEIRASMSSTSNQLSSINTFAIDDNDIEIIAAVKEVIKKRKEKLLKLSKVKPQELMGQLKDLVATQEVSKPKKTKGTVGFLE